jgi:hypothetical protein
MRRALTPGNIFCGRTGGADEQPVRVRVVDADLERMAAWLKACGIRTVAMRSTGSIDQSGGLEQPSRRIWSMREGRRTYQRDVQECQGR